MVAEGSTLFGSFDFQEGSSYILMIVDRLGLANRLRIMAGMYSIAQQTNRNLLVVWSPSAECGSPFSNLFEGLAFGVEVVDIDTTPHAVIANELGVLAGRRNISMSSQHLTGFDVDVTNMKKSKDDRDQSAILVFTLGTHSPGLVTCREYLSVKSAFYRSLVPVATVKVMVKDITERHFAGSIVVGVHIRAYGTAYDWEVVPPERLHHATMANESSSAALRFDQVGSIADFVRAMSDIAVRIPSVMFFVASNNPLVNDEIRSLYLHPENIIYRPALSYRDCAQGDEVCVEKLYEGRTSIRSVQAALADFLLLAQSSIIVHTRGSSFAREVGGLTLIQGR